MLGEGIKTVLIKKCCPGPPGLIHFWMQTPSKNRRKPGGKPLIGALNKGIHACIYILTCTYGQGHS